MAPLDAQQNSMLMKYNFFFLLCYIKIYSVFCEKFAKVDILSVIAIDLVKIFKQTKTI